jgi:glycosyltransferase involved in cell wall biosynthesis
VKKKKCILFSYGPVPTPEQTKVEGGGLRCWGLAKGLRANDKGMDITVAYHDSYKKKGMVSSFESIKIIAWNIANIKELILEFDTVIVSYCMGDLSVEIASSVQANQQLILDCYVPIYVEISARASNNLESEYYAFGNEIGRWSTVLRRGDIYLCANENQKRYYQGVLSALGRINPLTYEDDLIKIVPYGIYRQPPKVTSKPITALLGKNENKYKKILWFGAVYPWFDLSTLVEAVAIVNNVIPTKLVIVGAKNPFNAHPDFVQRYEELIDFIDSDPKHKDNVILQDWVEFNDRANWYLDSDLVILLNKIGNENELAWRTRLVDYIWADLPIVTNAGDPLGERLIAEGAAERLGDLSEQGLASSLLGLLNRPNRLEEIKHNLAKVRDDYYWDNVTKQLNQAILSNQRPTDFARLGLIEVANDHQDRGVIIKKLLHKIKKLPDYYHKYGIRNTYYAITTIILNRLGLSNRKVENRPKVIFIAHQLDTTGAPHVFIDLVRDFKEKHQSLPMEFHTFNPADKTNIANLNHIGVTPKIHLSKDISLNYNKGDIVIMNTVAFSNPMKDSIYDALDRGIIKRVVWYIHEDEPEYIFDGNETERIKGLMKRNLITIFVAAQKTKDNYVRHFGNKKQIRTQSYRVRVPRKYHKIREAKDFNTLRFILTGMVSDGRKGQLPILYAFIEFKKRYFDGSPGNYRDFSLTYVGVGQDFVSRQILKHTELGLGDRFTYTGPISHMDSLEHMLESNVTVCYSLRECLPMFVYEGMLAGHPLLRNDSSGMVEQLVNGQNGYSLASTDFEQVIETIERMCNKSATTNHQLSSMSKKSYSIVSKAKNLTYSNIIDVVIEAYEQ